MNRKEFLEMCRILGIGLPLSSLLVSCEKEDSPKAPFSGKVIIIGAGAGGLSAGYLLNQQAVDFEILEASGHYGGRIAINRSFADFPIPLGAEWIETDPGIFAEIVNDSSVNVDIPTIEDAPDLKFINSSWFDFFEEYIVPSISNKISYNAVVKSINYSGSQVIVSTQNEQFIADKVIVSVPLKVLQDGDLEFVPGLPQNKLDAINNTVIWEGFKAFFEFSENFYGDGFEFEITPATDGEKIYYNAAFGRDTNRNILGLFTVGKPARDYISRSGEGLKNFILDELDGIFSNMATASYINHITKNWNNDAFIKSGYMTDYADWRTVRELGKSINDKVYFAGGAYTDGEDWVSVHAAARSAKMAVEAL